MWSPSDVMADESRPGCWVSCLAIRWLISYVRQVGRSARFVCASVCPNDGLAFCKVAVGVWMHVQTPQFNLAQFRLLLGAIVFPVCGLCFCGLSLCHFKNCCLSCLAQVQTSSYRGADLFWLTRKHSMSNASNSLKLVNAHD